MDSLFSCEGGVAWTGGIKELLERSQKEQAAAAPNSYNNQCSSTVELELEPNSVLDAGDRFSPPLTSSSSSSLHHEYTPSSLVRNLVDDDDQTRDEYNSTTSTTDPDQLQLIAGSPHQRLMQITTGFHSNSTQQNMIDAYTWPNAETELDMQPNDVIFEYNAPSSWVTTQFCPMPPDHMDNASSWTNYLNGFQLAVDSCFPDHTYSQTDVTGFDVVDNHINMDTSISGMMMGFSADNGFEDDLVSMYINHTEQDLMTCDQEGEISGHRYDHEAPLQISPHSCNSIPIRRTPFATVRSSTDHLHEGELGTGSSWSSEYKELCRHLQSSSPLISDGSSASLHSLIMPTSAEHHDQCYDNCNIWALETDVLHHDQLEYVHCRDQTEMQELAADKGRASHGKLDNIVTQPADANNYIQQLDAQLLQDSGLQLVHLLLACAEAVAWRDLALAVSLLDQLLMFASHTGDAIQRVTYCFAEGLSARLALMSIKELAAPPRMQNILTSPPNISQKKEGLLQLYQCSPYLSFGFFAANQAILQAFEKKTHVHIVDLGMMQNLQWPGLIRALATRAEGPPEVLRITAFGAGMESMIEMTEWGRELREFANRLKVPLEFRAMGKALDTSKLTTEALDVRECETVAINSVLQLHKVVKESRGSLKGVLQRLQRLGAGVMTLIEQDANHNGPFFLGRFLESLHYYSAIFDSLEASMGRHSQQRTKVERLYFADEIRNIVACEGLERTERHERGDQWRRQMSRAGFQVVPLNFISQARMFLSLYSSTTTFCAAADAAAGSTTYSLCEEKGCLLLGWKSKPIVLASAWRPSSSSAAHQQHINSPPAPPPRP